jgi:hypothetical protein
MKFRVYTNPYGAMVLKGIVSAKSKDEAARMVAARLYPGSDQNSRCARSLFPHVVTVRMQKKGVAK